MDKQKTTELIEQAKILYPTEVKGIFKKMFETDTEQALFVTSVQLHSGAITRTNTVNTVGEEIANIAIQLYPNVKIGDEYYKVSNSYEEGGEIKSVKKFDIDAYLKSEESIYDQILYDEDEYDECVIMRPFKSQYLYRLNKNEKINILYIHGFESNIELYKAFLFRNDDVNIIAPYINYETDNAFDFLSEKIKKENIRGIIGQSIGGYLAYYLSNKFKIPCLIFNPAFNYSKVQPLPERIKKLSQYCNQIAVVGLKDNVAHSLIYLEEIDKIFLEIFIKDNGYDVTDNMKEKYFNVFISCIKNGKRRNNNSFEKLHGIIASSAMNYSDTVKRISSAYNTNIQNKFNNGGKIDMEKNYKAITVEEFLQLHANKQNDIILDLLLNSKIHEYISPKDKPISLIVKWTLISLKSFYKFGLNNPLDIKNENIKICFYPPSYQVKQYGILEATINYFAHHVTQGQNDNNNVRYYSLSKTMSFKHWIRTLTNPDRKFLQYYKKKYSAIVMKKSENSVDDLAFFVLRFEYLNKKILRVHSLSPLRSQINIFNKLVDKIDKSKKSEKLSQMLEVRSFNEFNPLISSSGTDYSELLTSLQPESNTNIQQNSDSEQNFNKKNQNIDNKNVKNDPKMINGGEIGNVTFDENREGYNASENGKYLHINIIHGSYEIWICESEKDSPYYPFFDNNYYPTLNEAKEYIINEIRRFNLTIHNEIKLLIERYKEDGIDKKYINYGYCMNFAEELKENLDNEGIKCEVFSDGMFFDVFGDISEEELVATGEYGVAPKNFRKIGLPSHYWIYCNNKHYDSDTPNGVKDMFELPTIKRFYKNRFEDGGEINESELAKARKAIRTLNEMMLYKKVTDGSDKSLEDIFIDKVVSMIYEGADFKSKRDIERVAEKEFGFNDKQKVRELTEYATLIVGRDIAKNNPVEEAYTKLVSLYSNQPYSTHRTNVSVALGQFSTPLPMAYLMGVYVGINKESNKIYFEPTAGNGALSISGDPKDFIVNELDKDRISNLEKEGYAEVLNQDANSPFKFDYNYFDGMLANPPFASLSEKLIIDGYQISGLEQQIIVKCLRYIKPEGKTAFIIGGHTEYDSAGRLKSAKDKAFLSYLFSHYYMDDVINVNGDLYGRQGTKYPIRIILLAGRKQTVGGYYPLANFDVDNLTEFSTKQINSFSELLVRMKTNLQ